MIALGERVKESHITGEAMLESPFVVRADSCEKAVKKLIAELRAADPATPFTE